jgi:hypothetical protein
MANIARPTKIWDQTLNDWVFLAGVVDTTKSYTYTADQTFPGITATSINGGPIVGRNKIINGDFSIWQRGTSFSLSTGAVTFASDRWFWVMPGGTTVSRQSFSPGNSPVSGYEGQYYVNTTLTANGQNYEMGQRVEDVRTFANQRVTLSFWARSTAGAQPLGYALFQHFGTGGSPSSMVQATQVTGSGPYTPTSTWQRYSYTFDLPSISGKTIGTNNDSYLLVRPMQFTSTTTNTSVDIWGVQLESGSVATPFHAATANKQAELAACQRYYTTSIPDGYTTSNFPTVSTGTGCIIGWCSSGSTNDLFTNIQYAVPMRSTPSLSIFSASNRTSGSIRDMVTGSDITVSGIGPQAGQNRGVSYFSGMSATSNRAYGFHYVASAEL